MCDPSASGPYENGLVQPAHAAPSTWHWKPVTDSLALKANVPLDAFEFAEGLESIDVVGATLSITKRREDVQEDGLTLSCACACQ